MNVFSEMKAELERLFNHSEALDSGNGIRFRSPTKGSVTLYNKEIADGNLAEIAFGIQSICKATKRSESEVLQIIKELETATGRLVKINATFKWPRVGMSEKEHVSTIASRLSQFYK